MHIDTELWMYVGKYTQLELQRWMNLRKNVKSKCEAQMLYKERKGHTKCTQAHTGNRQYFACVLSFSLSSRHTQSWGKVFPVLYYFSCRWRLSDGFPVLYLKLLCGMPGKGFSLVFSQIRPRSFMCKKVVWMCARVCCVSGGKRNWSVSPHTRTYTHQQCSPGKA